MAQARRCHRAMSRPKRRADKRSRVCCSQCFSSLADPIQWQSDGANFAPASTSYYRGLHLRWKMSMQDALLLKDTNGESSALREFLESRVERALPSAFRVRRALSPPLLRGFLNAL